MIKRSFEIFGGSLLIILGIIGWVVPIMPGTVLFFAGIILITPHHGQRIIKWMKKKFSKKKD